MQEVGGRGYAKLEVSLKHPSGDVEEAIGYKSDEFERELWFKNIHLRVRGTYSTLEVTRLLRSLRK